MNHVDLFSGIGGFAYAFDQVFHEQKNTHIFCEIDKFCQAVLRKHWPDSEIISDIKTFADTRVKKQRGVSDNAREKVSATWFSDQPFLLTGGFPCQPFSQAGQRRGTEDDRHLWPEMLRVIRLTKPQWVIAENVPGLLTIGGGMVFEQVCLDLEHESYKVQPIIIPAVALNAPHRRDRVWFIANRRQQHGSEGRDEGMEINPPVWPSRLSYPKRCGEDDSDSECARHEGKVDKAGQNARHRGGSQQKKWGEDWTQVATRLCRVDDGIPRRMDRNPRLRALGNAIVPQVAMEIMRAIKLSTGQ